MHIPSLHAKQLFSIYSACVYLWLNLCVAPLAHVQPAQALGIDSSHLRRATEKLFYHGYENYMKHAFPEDEIRPLSCTPHTRDQENPGHFEVNDALGNYSLTLIDSLSTLAILASHPSDSARNKPLLLFQDGVKSVVEQYGDGTKGDAGQGLRARGFELDSKVQVFETAIRGLGGLLSAHLFAIGELPIRGYSPIYEQGNQPGEWFRNREGQSFDTISWPNGFIYDGQLLRLAYDLGRRLIPAFWTSTGIPYPRVNLRSGIPFYAKSPRNFNPNEGQCTDEHVGTDETTETCSAGAGSLVLEFTVLSRLTGDPRFEELAKRAFWAIWSRRSQIDLIGAGIDAETGEWIGHYTGIGAGIDSFFEYAFKTYILLQQNTHPPYDDVDASSHPGLLFTPLVPEQTSSSGFHQVWETAHAAIQRHLLRASNFQHPHYVQADLRTGAGRAFWIDSLSAYYPGLLVLSGHIEEAVEAHLLVTALWTRFSAIPERYNLVTGGVEGGLGWWPGRPEFIESNYYLARATEDPWYKFVAEMTLRDIERRCWAECGWAGIQNVLTGEKADRMESFFLGETAKYLFLTFDDEHPLNRLDAPFVFSTEGHPLIIPKNAGLFEDLSSRQHPFQAKVQTCPIKPQPSPFSSSATASRGDLFHAASLAKLHQMPKPAQGEPITGDYAADHPSLTSSGTSSPSNFTYYPWTLPPNFIPFNATSSPMRAQPTFELAFPAMTTDGASTIPIQKVVDGIQINSLSGLRLSLIRDVPLLQDGDLTEGYRVQYVNSFGLGKDEKVYLLRDGGFGTMDPADPNFTKTRNSQVLDLVVDIEQTISTPGFNSTKTGSLATLLNSDEAPQGNVKAAWDSLVSQLTNLVQDSPHITFPFTNIGGASETAKAPRRIALPAIVPAGVGAAPIPDWSEASGILDDNRATRPLLWTRVYAADELCDHKLPQKIARDHQVVVIKRGGCSFSKKLSNVPLYAPSPQSLQLVVVVNYGSHENESDDNAFFRPLLDEVQMSSSGLPRSNPIPMIMVGGGEDSYQSLRYARGVGIKRRYSVRSQGVPITNLIVV